MKKVLSFLFASLMLVAVSCSKTTNETDTQNDTTEVVDSASVDTTVADTLAE